MAVTDATNLFPNQPSRREEGWTIPAHKRGLFMDADRLGPGVVHGRQEPTFDASQYRFAKPKPVRYSLYVQMPTLSSSGDVSICTHTGTYRSFFFDLDGSRIWRLLAIHRWFKALAGQGIVLSKADRTRLVQVVGYPRTV